MSRTAVKKSPRIGAHTSIAGSLEKAAEKAAALGCETFQIFSRSPRMWRCPKLDPAAVERLKLARERHGLAPLVIHGNYLTNMAAADRAVRSRSIRAFRDELERAVTLGADYLVIHPGSYRGQTPARALGVLSESIARASDGFPWDGLKLLLENTAGGGETIGRDFSELAELREKIERRAAIPMAFCLDTAHCYEGGFDIKTPSGLAATLRDIDRTIGIKNVNVIHANDSKTPRGSRLDRHEHIGRGTIGREAFRRLLHHPKFADKAFILETPNDHLGGYEFDIAQLKSLLRRRPRVANSRPKADRK